MKLKSFVIILLIISIQVKADPLRLFIAGEVDVSLNNPDGSTVSLSYNDTVLIHLSGDLRFLRGIQLELTAPQSLIGYPGNLASALYVDLNQIPSNGIVDIDARQVNFEVLPNKILNIWQIPLRTSHGLRNSPYITIATDTINPISFPMLFRLMPVIKGISQELERMIFHLNVKPILIDEGAVKLNFSYPEQVQRRPIVVLINDEVVDIYEDELFLREGEHHLLILSDDYRNLSRRFVIERARILNLNVELQDPTPLLVFEHPEGTVIFVDSVQVMNTQIPFPVEPGLRNIRFEMSDYSIIRPITVQRGMTYRISLSVDVNITESEQ